VPFRPVGRSWRSLGLKPKVQIIAVSEDQTINTWDPVLEMGREGKVSDNYHVDLHETFISVPRGRIEYVTSSSSSREGFRPVFAVMDQTETWRPGVGGPKLAAAVRRNLVKTGGCSVESPNAFVPGEGSVAEESWKAYELQQNGKTKTKDILVDHREAPPETELGDYDSLKAGLRIAYGDSTWVDLDRVIADCWDPATEPQDARRYFLNQVTHATDSYLSQPEWAACKDAEKVIEDGDVITLGFDGSRGRSDAKPDATALIGCRIEDGHLFEIAVWEAPDTQWDGWTPPLVEIDAAVEDAFKRFTVGAFYADPARDWRSKVNEWEAKYAGKLASAPNGKRVTVTRDHPFEWWMTGGRSIYIERAVKAFAGDVRNNGLTHDGSFRLTQHALNARRRTSHQHLTLGKEHSSSPRKIDACVAAVIAWQARLDCIAAGIGTKPKRRAPIRVR
jgi:hypothetical protein